MQPLKPWCVLDASTAVAWLSDVGDIGIWARRQLVARFPAAPDLVLYETSNALRNLALRDVVTWEQARAMQRELVGAQIATFPFPALATRTWELAPNLTTYDASYVALAELLEAPLITLDQRLARAPGVRCEIVAYAEGV